MTGFVYATMLAYSIVAVGVVAFLVWVGPALVMEAVDFAKKITDPTTNEWVERLLLAVEELREWHQTPGRHRAVISGVHSPEETFFTNLIEEWRDVEDELRREIIVRKELINA